MNTKRTLRKVIVSFVVIMSFNIGTTIEPVLADVKDKTWDYVIMGSSIGTWWADIFAKMVTSDMGIEIRQHDYYEPSQPTEDLLRNVLYKEKLRGDIKKAELITIGVGYADMYFGAMLNYRFLDLDAKQLNQKMKNDRQKFEQELNIFRKTYDSLLTEVLKLVADDTLIRVMDFYFPFVAEYKKLGIYDQPKYYWKSFNECIIRSARDHSIPVARVFQLFNGADGDEDPVEKGLIAADGSHSSNRGKELIAEEFRKLGYQ